jgi:lysophospholipase L1-like esterase
MADQIIDRKQVFLSGPIGHDGPQGPRGLPGVNAVPADQAVAAYVTASGSATHAALGLDRTLMAVFGDSICRGGQDGVTMRYSSQIAARLGLTEMNYAYSGSGFGPRTVSGTTYPQIATQIDTALADPKMDTGKVSLILIGGGINDTEDTSAAHLQDVIAGADTWISRARQAFPNARIVASIGQGGWHDATGNFLFDRIKVYEPLAARFATAGIPVMPMWRALWGQDRDAVFVSDYVHPSQAGHDRMAGMALAFLGGSGFRVMMRAQSGSWTTANGAGGQNPELMNTAQLTGTRFISCFAQISLDDAFQVHCMVNLAIRGDYSSGSQYLPILNLPPYAYSHGLIMPASTQIMPYAGDLSSQQYLSKWATCVANWGFSDNGTQLTVNIPQWQGIGGKDAGSTPVYLRASLTYPAAQ